MQSIKRLIAVMTVFCMVSVACFEFIPQAYAETADGGNTEVTEPPVIITGWHEGLYYDSEGQPVVDTTMEIEGVVYSFDAAGASVLFTGLWNNYRYKDGKKFTGVYNGYRYSGGKKLTGTYNGKHYYGGKLFTGKRFVNNRLYTYKEGVRGNAYTGRYSNYYYDNGYKVTKYKRTVKKVSNGYLYYFKKDGTVSYGTGWLRLNGKRYYLKNGRALTEWRYIGGYKYYFDKNTGVLCQDLIARFGPKWKKKNLKIKVNRQQNCVTIYAKDGDNGYIIPVKAMACSVGKKSSKTIKGTYTLKKDRTYRWRMVGGPTMGGYCWAQYATRIHGSFLFHSVPYDKQNIRTLQTAEYNKLGEAASHGCIRMRVKDVKLIYDIARYRNTKVTIYDSDWVGPFDKPVIKDIPLKQKYDPSDPAI